MTAVPKSERLLTDTLRGVSRAFYLTLRVLPQDLRAPIGLAYLLARAADTISDTTLLPPSARLFHLRALRALLARWLSLFHVRHRPEIVRHLKNLVRRGAGGLRLEPLAGRYAFIARFRKCADVHSGVACIGC